jgi:hypothetical protein
MTANHGYSSRTSCCSVRSLLRFPRPN